LSDASEPALILPLPHEFAIGGVYLPPLLVAAVFGVLLAILSGRLLNRYRLSQHFFYPPLVMVAMMVFYTVLIGTFVIGS
jgi:hypothetical protein